MQFTYFIGNDPTLDDLSNCKYIRCALDAINLILIAGGAGT